MQKQERSTAKQAKPRAATAKKATQEYKRADRAQRKIQRCGQVDWSAVDAGVAICDREFRCLAWNSFMEQLTGCPAGKVLGKNVIEASPHMRQTGIDQLLKRAMAGETVASADTPYRSPKTGKIGWVVATYAPLRDECGRIVGVVTTVHDITPRKETEQALHRSEQYAHSIVDSSLDMIVTVDNQRKIVEFNHAAQEAFGYARDQVLGKHVSLLYADPTEGLEVHRTTFERERHVQEVYNKRKNGEIFVSQLSAAVMRNPEGEPLGIVGVSRDITDRLRAEEARTRRAQEMELLYRTSLEINSQPDLRTLLQATVSRAADLLGARMGGLYLTESDDQSLRLTISHNLPGNLIGTTLKLGEGLSGRVAQTGEPILVDDYHRWTGRAPVYEKATFRRVLGVPLKLGNRVIGVLNITDDEQAGLYSEDQVRLISLFANQAAIAIENARLYENLQRELAEHKRTEAALRESEERYRDLFENANDFIQSVAPDGRFVYVNRAWQETLGYSAEDLSRLTIFDVIAPEDRQHCQELFRQVLSGEKLDRLEVTFLAKDGRRITVEGRVSCRFVDGKPISTRGIFRDITEHKQAQEEMLLEKVRFQQLFENSPIGIAMLDAEDKIQAINSAFQTIFQYTPEEVVGRPINDVVVPSNYLEEASRLSAEALSGAAVEMESVRRRKDGSLVPVEIYGVPIIRDGKSIAIYGIYADISKLKEMETRLRREVEKLKALHEIDRALSTLDLQDCLRVITQRARALFAGDLVSILLLEEDQLRMAAEDGLVSTTKEVVVPLDKGITGWSCAKNQSILVPDVRQDERYIEVDVRSRSEMAAPLKIHDQSIGVLNVESVQLDAFTPADLELLESLAARAATAIHNARLHSAEREHREFAETLQDIGMALASKLDPDAVIDLLLDEVARVLPYDTAAVLLLDNGLVRTKRQRGYEQFSATQQMDALEMPMSSLPILADMALRGQPRAVPDTSQEPLWIALTTAQPIRSWLGAPIIAHGKVLGFVTLQKATANFYKAEMEERLATYATQAGLAFENARLYAEQQKLAITDGLTGLFNRRYLFDIAQREYMRARRRSSPLAMLMLDMNGFKQINDTFGHSVGDEVLQRVAKTLAENVRAVDIVARYGGDEFVILLPDCNDQMARQVADRLQEQIKVTRLYVEARSVAPTLSIGIAVATLAPDETLDTLLVRADAEMYRSKRQYDEALVHA